MDASDANRKQTFVAASTTIGVVVPIYVLATYLTLGVQNAISNLAGIPGNPHLATLYDVVVATVLAAFAVLVATAIFLVMSRRMRKRRLMRGLVAALPVIAAGSALGRYLLNPAAPMPGLVAVILTILISTVISMLVAGRRLPV